MKRFLIALLILVALLCSCEKESEQGSQSQSSALGSESSESFSTESLESIESSESVESESQSQLVTITYDAGVGGTIEGEAVQTLEVGATTTEIKLRANKGYKFLGWSDGGKKMHRSDVATQTITYTATYERFHIVKYTVNNSAQGRIYGVTYQRITDGESTVSVTALPRAGFRFAGWSTGEKSASLQLTPSEDMSVEAIFERVSLELPALIVNTVGSAPIVSKKDYLSCSVTIENAGEFCFDGLSAQVRGRGNTSFEVDKKSYKIKLDKGADLFGNGKAKDWTLISNHFDLSLIRNYLAYSVASKFSALESTTTTQFVDLYINDQFQGVYLLCEQVEAGKNRVDITESVEVDTGYLIELDSRADGIGFFCEGKFHVIKSPDTDDYYFTDEHKAFISDYLTRCMNAIKGGNYDEIEALIDTESFAQAYIVFETFKCVDVGYSSFYMYKDVDGKLICGPVWDFDRSLGNVRDRDEATRYDVLWAIVENPWFRNLMQVEEFRALVCERLDEYLPTIRATLDGCYAYVESRPIAFNRNFERWDILGTWVWPNPDELLELESWQEQVDFTKDYLEKSLAFMVQSYPSTSE